MVEVPEKVVRLLPKKDGVHWLTLVVSIVVACATSIGVGAYQAGRYSERFDNIIQEQHKLSAYEDSLTASTNNLASGVSALTAQVGSLRDAIAAERQDRLWYERRTIPK